MGVAVQGQPQCYGYLGKSIDQCPLISMHVLFIPWFIIFIQVFKKEPSHFPYFFKCVMEAVLAGEEAGLTLKEQTVLLVFLDHCFNSLVCHTPTNVYLSGNVE